VDKRFKLLIRVRAIAVIWSLWLCRNDNVFFNNKSYCLIDVINQCRATVRLWLPLHRLDHHDLFTKVSTRLEDTMINIFSNMGGSVIYGLALLHHRYVLLYFILVMVENLSFGVYAI
jgi:hypothetical protein